MRVSVITVTFNALPALKKTMASVMAQTSLDYEYIIVDGASTDGTAEYLSEKADGSYRWISEPDSGIYEAMNKGVRMAQGEYCLFINAGDCFVDAKVLATVLPFMNGVDLVIGNQIDVSEQGVIADFYQAKGSFSLNNLLQSSVCHQSTFIRRSVLLERPYDEHLRLVSDWKFFLELYLGGNVSYRTVDVNICFFFEGGATDKNRDLGKQERMSVLAGYPEYEHIWGKPYCPSFVNKIKRKYLFYVNKIIYANKLKKCNVS